MLKFVEFRIGGSLYLSEILLLILFLVMLVTHKIKLEEKMAWMFILFCILWLYGQVLTDVIRDTPFGDFSRGWAKIVFTIINFTVLFQLINYDRRSIVIFIAGLVVGGFLEFSISPNIYAQNNPWKFGIGVPIALTIVIAVSAVSENRPLIRSGILILASILNMNLGFRSMAGFLFLTAIYILLQWRWNKYKGNDLKLLKNKILLLCFIFGAASFLLMQGYGYAAKNGYLGQGAMRKYQLQSYGKFGLLIGGRSEILISAQAIFDSPVIGHGSWAKDEKYAGAYLEIKRLFGYSILDSNETDLIPTHSHLFGSWVEAGFLGALFWIWILFFPIACLSSMFQTKEKLTPLFSFICFNLIWDILFSPYAGERRFITPFYLIALLIIFNDLKYHATCQPK
jgi:hypothetical protein